MGYELKMFGLKLLCSLLVTPLMWWVIIRLAESFEKSWKTNNLEFPSAPNEPIPLKF